jgi:hypothetical protein
MTQQNDNELIVSETVFNNPSETKRAGRPRLYQTEEEVLEHKKLNYQRWYQAKKATQQPQPKKERKHCVKKEFYEQFYKENIGLVSTLKELGVQSNNQSISVK